MTHVALDDTLLFDVSFHGPFHVFTGSAGQGSDSVVDLEDPLPASGLKGAMRRSATFLGLPDALVGAVFGAPRAPSPWAWDIEPATIVLTVEGRARVPIDPLSGSARSGAIRFAEELWAPEDGLMRLSITRQAWIDTASRPGHVVVLRAAARALTSLGADRNRGYGWVSVRDVKPLDVPEPDLAELADAILELRTDRRGAERG